MIPLVASRPPLAHTLAEWAAGLAPTPDDLALASRALLDTVSVGLAARREPILRTVTSLTEEARWATACHVLDFDDLHLPSTTHISTVCVPVAAALGGGARSYLAGAGVMARVGTALGWRHYAAGWHATTTAGAIGAAVTAGAALGLDADGLARAMALAVPAGGGVQRSFGTDAKSLQVGFAAHAGVRAARLAAAGATADPTALDQWMQLLGGAPFSVETSGTAIPGGLAVKLHPCCYALQRPMGAAGQLRTDGVPPSEITSITVRTPAATLVPLIHANPRTGLEAKFSMEYAVSAALLADHPGLPAFTDDAVLDPHVRRLMALVRVEAGADADSVEGGGGGPGGSSGALLSGQVEVLVSTGTASHRATLVHPPGSPDHPPGARQLLDKATDCLAASDVGPDDITWGTAGDVLRDQLDHGRARSASRRQQTTPDRATAQRQR